MIKRPGLVALISALGSPSEAERESAIARLTLAGDRATRRIAAIVSDASASTQARVSGLRVLSATPGRVSIEAALTAVDAHAIELVDAACGLLGRSARDSGPDATRALDALTGLALSPSAPVDHRLAAITALEGLPGDLIRPVFEALSRDTSVPAVNRAAHAQTGREWSLTQLAEAGLTNDPVLVTAAVRDEADSAPITDIRRLIDAIRQRESTAGDDRATWRAIRGTLHEVLARRSSRIALYDLRETFEVETDAVPVGFLAAAALIGDTATLESLAVAWDRANPEDRWYREHLADAFEAIARREHVSRDHPVLRKVLARRPGATALAARAPKSTRRNRSRRKPA